MAKITRGEHGLLADGKPIEKSSFSELSDAELEEETGGIKVYLHIDHHWYGSSKTWLRCPQCKCEDFDIVGWIADNVVLTCCKKCGSRVRAGLY